MEFRMVELLPFQAASSGVDANVDFSEPGWDQMESFIPIRLLNN
ncbi:hypothetical protein [Enterococcus raffinosus]|uniref:Uncharacterized protein n=1 Tax=Enterococcus raffinosus TaxID=71452 RepID=A0AAW8T357_9ENTE|nr:hypothetical protein [Enterococcus raffinosus]MDT2521948.1 hypothetical protein [Enterococcus raffinosus]MDT2528293.1 hypothetical protein [Enterococcus raffinosus]MDT2533242.1 hypothetical protein [Enterococcus raffinosus]MDT2543683.1 hypothetical protein [Enterococcus raffinosus]MDT2553796.1 hypothetical protein [Enterococcus raffinosus]